MIAADQYRDLQDEAAFQQAVVAYAELRGWLVFHFPNARFNPTLPDLLLLRDGVCRLIELKSARGSLGSRQREMCARLFDAGFPVLVATPHMWDDIEAWLR